MSYDWAPYVAATHCSGAPGPGTLYLAAFIEEQFPELWVMNIYSCRAIFGGSGYSHHAEGRADDHGVPTTSTGGAIPSIAMPVLDLLGPHGRALGLDHWIYNRRIYAAAYPQGRYYTGKHPHRDHHHIGLTRTAAARLTLTTIRAIVLGEVPDTGDEVTYKKGDTGNVIKFYQTSLLNWAKSKGRTDVTSKLKISGTFDDATVFSVGEYQKAADLPKTGQIDWGTAVLLAEYNPDKIG